MTCSIFQFSELLCVSNSCSNSYPKNRFLLLPHMAAAGAEDLSTHMGPIAVVEFELAASMYYESTSLESQGNCIDVVPLIFKFSNSHSPFLSVVE